MNDNVGGSKRFDRFDGQQAGIARPCADKDNATARCWIEKT
jgi:hypothetical protein